MCFNQFFWWVAVSEPPPVSFQLQTFDSYDGAVGPRLGSLRFQHVFTLSRGVTPAVISGIAVSETWH